MATMVKDRITDKAIEKVAESIDALAERAKDALYDLAHGARDASESASELREGAWRLAERARKEAGGIAGDLYTRGQQTAVAVGRRVGEQPWIALALVGVFGLILGYTLRRG
jgi:ElaB/YqjD/DUF883 family membrane-anchored ribosome-binding protein